MGTVQPRSGSQIEFVDFGKAPLTTLLELKEIPIARDDDPKGDPFPQLSYIERYVAQLQCKSLVIEREYIDRDYMEDHSVFYARCLSRYQNFCQRVHFFKAP